MTVFTLRVGALTDVGQVRTINQDAIVNANGIHGVADGMGGHQGGEVASAIAADALNQGLDDATPEGFDAAVQAANFAVWEQSQAREDLAGMGTTATVLAEVMVGDQAHIVLVNVGDSRGYLLRDGALVQITDDHSLVADLVRAGRITEEEAATHPRRNIVTRVLGLDEKVRVDQFAVVPFNGDRFLLCSDGLTNEVSEDEIAATLLSISDPDEAAAELVRQANEGGGRDNITVVIVDVTDDGGVAEAASAALADDPSGLESDDDELAELAAAAKADQGASEAAVAPSAATEPESEPDGEDAPHDPTAEQPALVVADPVSGERANDDERSDDGDEIDDEDGAAPARTGRFSWRVAGFLFVVFVVVGIAIGALTVYARGTYFVGFDDGGRVSVFQGRPGGVLIFDPTLEAHTNLVRGDLLEVSVSDVDGDPDFGSLDEATAFILNLQLSTGSKAPATGAPGSFDDEPTPDPAPAEPDTSTSTSTPTESTTSTTTG